MSHINEDLIIPKDESYENNSVITASAQEMQNQGIAQIGVIVNAWLAKNIEHMEASTVNAPACWYDGSDGTCSA